MSLGIVPSKTSLWIRPCLSPDEGNVMTTPPTANQETMESCSRGMRTTTYPNWEKFAPPWEFQTSCIQESILSNSTKRPKKYKVYEEKLIVKIISLKCTFCIYLYISLYIYLCACVCVWVCLSCVCHIHNILFDILPFSIKK